MMRLRSISLLTRSNVHETRACHIHQDSWKVPCDQLPEGEKLKFRPNYRWVCIKCLAAANIRKVSYSIMAPLKVCWKMESQENLPRRWNFWISTYCCPFVGKQMWLSPGTQPMLIPSGICTRIKKIELLLDMYKVYEGHSHHPYTYLSLRDSQTRISSFTHYRWQIEGKIYPWRIGVKSLHFSPKVWNKFSSTQQAFIKQALIWFRHCVRYWSYGRTQSMVVPVPRLSGIAPSHGPGTEMQIFFFLGAQVRSLLHIYVLLR